jgi:hypothetical protein
MHVTLLISLTALITWRIVPYETFVPRGTPNEALKPATAPFLNAPKRFCFAPIESLSILANVHVWIGSAREPVFRWKHRVKNQIFRHVFLELVFPRRVRAVRPCI